MLPSCWCSLSRPSPPGGSLLSPPVPKFLQGVLIRQTLVIKRRRRRRRWASEKRPASPARRSRDRGGAATCTGAPGHPRRPAPAKTRLRGAPSPAPTARRTSRTLPATCAATSTSAGQDRTAPPRSSVAADFRPAPLSPSSTYRLFERSRREALAIRLLISRVLSD